MSAIDVILQAATLVGVPSNLLLALCFVETGHRNVIRPMDGGSPSYGICQIKLGTARMFDKRITPGQLMEPKTNAKFAALYLKSNLGRFHNNYRCSVSAYNFGPAGFRCPAFDNMYRSGHSSYTNKVMRALETKPWMK